METLLHLNVWYSSKFNRLSLLFIQFTFYFHHNHGMERNTEQQNTYSYSGRCTVGHLISMNLLLHPNEKCIHLMFLK